MIFSRRWAQEALNQIDIPSENKHDLISRLSYLSNADGVYSALWELAVIWSISQSANISEPYPSWMARSVPEACFDINGIAEPVLVEVKTIFGQVLTDEQRLLRALNIIENYIRSEKLALPDLYIRANSYLEWPMRYSGITGEFELDQEIRDHLYRWVENGASGSIDINKGRNRLTLSVRPKNVGKLHVDMPDEVWDAERNRLYQALKTAGRQMEGAWGSFVKIAVVCDGGSEWIKKPFRRSRAVDVYGRKPNRGGSYTPKDVAEHYLRKNKSLDIIVFIWVEEGFREKRKREVSINILCREGVPDECCLLIERALHNLPSVSYGPYQSSNSTLAGEYKPERKIRHSEVRQSIKSYSGDRQTAVVSRNVLQRYLAGEITFEEFREKTRLPENTRKRVIVGVDYECSGVQADDDKVLIHFGDDAAGMNFS
ncbi:hypothetical protein [Jannaschia sp. LMIT008]|uniref:hypothetical protein n=1 Tax=Jannaschia maritima TaxID=3032585 RepID=UPI002811B319|nr:hypothetical protein [Jannaschia sp. LMIT008]